MRIVGVSGPRITVATYAAKADSFVPDKPREWSDKRLANLGSNVISDSDLAKDGKRIVALMPAETPDAPQTQNHVIFLMNFADELRRKLPASKQVSLWGQRFCAAAALTRGVLGNTGAVAKIPTRSYRGCSAALRKIPLIVAGSAIAPWQIRSVPPVFG